MHSSISINTLLTKIKEVEMPSHLYKGKLALSKSRLKRQLMNNPHLPQVNLKAQRLQKEFC